MTEAEHILYNIAKGLSLFEKLELDGVVCIQLLELVHKI